ncbi:MAG: cellulase family glycosylhydrolase [Cytophagaceae bacterium]|nr:cellulase family glycosylhydrolase [Cytophagaceae bacterium]
MKLRNSITIFLFSSALIFQSCSNNESKTANDSKKDSLPKYNYVKVNSTHFEINGKPYYYLGANFWAGMNLASKGPGGDRERVLRELDRLQNLGINNLRIVAGSEGPNDAPYRMSPALQKSPGVYDKDLLDGLDFLLAEMGKRKMYAVVCLNDYWHWSGGMGQYLVWAGEADSIPYPPPHVNGDWYTYEKFAAKFYSSEKAKNYFKDFIKTIISRRNEYTGLLYSEDPAIMAWQLGNEPRGTSNEEKFNEWIDQTCTYIKSLDKNHLVTTGCEGKTPWDVADMDFEKNHDGKDVDYTTIHIWAQNWNWYNPLKADKTYDLSVKKMQTYLSEHVEVAKKLNKPVVVEEFGLSRDKGSFDPASATVYKDKYYAAVFDTIYKAAKAGSPVAGVNFWAWGGEGRPPRPGQFWKAGDSWLGDPPHEQQGWYSVYDKDSTTIKVITDYTGKMNALNQ